jgi:LPS sulfotransferase NodH
LLADALRATGLAGRPEEYYWNEFRDSYLDQWGRPPVVTYADFLAYSFRAGTTPNGVFGAKLHWRELGELLVNLAELSSHARPVADDQLLEMWFPAPKYVYLHRVDKIRQAISLFRASRTADWYQVDGDDARAHPSLQPDWRKIYALEMSLRADEQSWKNWFTSHGIEPIEIVYEDLIECYDDRVRATLDFLGVEGDITRPRLQRQRNETTEAWVADYIRVRRTWWLQTDDAYGLSLV